MRSADGRRTVRLHGKRRRQLDLPKLAEAYVRLAKQLAAKGMTAADLRAERGDPDPVDLPRPEEPAVPPKAKKRRRRHKEVSPEMLRDASTTLARYDAEREPLAIPPTPAPLPVEPATVLPSASGGSFAAILEARRDEIRARHRRERLELELRQAGELDELGPL